MSNKDNLWRLHDDNGMPVAEKPEKEKSFKSFKGADIIATFNGKVIGELQSITMERVESFRARPAEHIFRQEYMASWGDPGDDRPVGIRRETIEQEHPNIIELMVQEHHEYEYRYRGRPEYLSLSVDAYRSFWVEVRARERMSSGLNETRFMGIEVMCHPTQERPVMALGRAYQEGIEGRMYRVES